MTTTAQQLETQIAALGSLPTLPAVVQKICKMADDKSSSASDAAQVIAMDQVLCSKILRMVNSPIYGFPGRISTVKHALVLLGFNVVKGLLLGSAVFSKMVNGRNRALWQHSLGCAVISRRIAREISLPDAEEVMVAGLLHDLGKVVLAQVAGADYDVVLQVAQASGTYIGQAEQDVLGTDHARVGGTLAKQWCFPPRLSEPLQFHHAPGKAVQSRDVTAVVHLADILARGMGYGSPGDTSMPALDQEAFQSLRLSFPQLDKIIEDADAEYSAGAALFDTGD